MKESRSLELQVVICPSCRVGIYSRTRHDYNVCPCTNVAVDGGFDYCRVVFTSDLFKPRTITLKIKGITKRDLYDDWNYQTGKYGILGEREVRSLYYQQFKKNLQMVRRIPGSKKKGGKT